MRIFILSLVILLSVNKLIAQADYRPGYIITFDEDTLNGFIDYRGDLLLSSECRFIKNENDSVAVYSPFSIKSYGFEEGRLFVSKRISVNNIQSNAFLEYLIDGELDVFYYRDQSGNHFFIEKEGEDLIEIPYKEELTIVDGIKYLQKSKTHYRLLKIYMKETPELYSEIDKISKPTGRNLVKLANEYHDIVCKTDNCKIYKKRKKVQIYIDILGGVTKYKESFTQDDIYATFGSILHFGIPSLNEKIFLKTGLIYSKINYHIVSEFSDVYETRNYLKFPIHFEYRYPKGNFRPFLSYGVNLYNYDLNTVSITGGINYSIRKFSVGLNLDSEFKTNTLITPSKFFSLSALAGVSYNFTFKK